MVSYQFRNYRNYQEGTNSMQGIGGRRKCNRQDSLRCLRTVESNHQSTFDTSSHSLIPFIFVIHFAFKITSYTVTSIITKSFQICAIIIIINAYYSFVKALLYHKHDLSILVGQFLLVRTIHYLDNTSYQLKYMQVRVHHLFLSHILMKFSSNVIIIIRPILR